VSRRAWGLFAVVSLLWGMPYALIKVALRDVSPAELAFLRVTIGFVVLAPHAWRSGAMSGLRGRLRPLFAYTVIELAFAWPLIGLGEQRISTSMTACLLAAVPLILALIAWRVDHERPTQKRLGGLALGFVGVITLAGPESIGSLERLVGAGAVLAAAACYAIAPLIIKHHLADLDPVGPVTASFGIAALLLAPAALATAPARLPGAQAVAAVGVLGLACSAAAFVAFFTLIAQVGPARASLITYILPVVAGVIGVVFLGERLGPAAIFGAALIMAGSRLASADARSHACVEDPHAVLDRGIPGSSASRPVRVSG
jgi:drug/metabolite transporter (DMT)-like permease